jgi:MraZ protein
MGPGHSGQATSRGKRSAIGLQGQQKMAVFRGHHPAKVDDKGRLKLPSAFKDLVEAEHVTQFYITSSDGKSAEIWPLPEWEKRERQLMDSSNMDDAVQKYLDLTSYYGQQVEIDNQARVLLPHILRGAAKLDAEVAVFGKLNYLEVRNREIFEENLPAREMTVEDRRVMAAILKRHAEN